MYEITLLFSLTRQRQQIDEVVSTSILSLGLSESDETLRSRGHFLGCWSYNDKISSPFEPSVILYGEVMSRDEVELLRGKPLLKNTVI